MLCHKPLFWHWTQLPVSPMIVIKAQGDSMIKFDGRGWTFLIDFFGGDSFTLKIRVIMDIYIRIYIYTICIYIYIYIYPL